MSLAVDNLRVFYRTTRGDVRALDGVTFTVADGEIMGLAGESGCGKTTLGKSLIRLDGRMRVVEGAVELDGVELPIGDDSAMNAFRYREVSIVPQYAMSALNPIRKIGVMISELLRLARRRLRRDAAGAEPPADARRPRRRGPRALPDRALGRNEAASRAGPLDAPQPVAPDRRRAHLRAGRVDPEGGGGNARRVPRSRLREEHDRDHPRPLDPLPDRRHDPRHVRRQAGREGDGDADHRGSAAPVHEAADRVAARRSGCASPSSG